MNQGCLSDRGTRRTKASRSLLPLGGGHAPARLQKRTQAYTAAYGAEILSLAVVQSKTVIIL
jgi:hypothetical protein